MIFSTFNIISIFIFILIFLLNSFFCYKSIEKIKKYTAFSEKIKRYKIISIYLYFISICIISLTVFGIKGDFILGKERKISSNILFLLDVSKSMNVEDVSYKGKKVSRLEGSKNFIKDYIKENPYNNYALSIFAGESLRILPFINDISIYKTILSGVNEDNLSKFGSNFDIAIKDSISTFKQNNKLGLIVMISDIGEKNNFSSLKNIYNDSINILVVGVGTEKGGFIPIGKDSLGLTIYKIYNSKKVVSSLIKDNLKELSSKLNAKYSILRDISDFKALSSLITSESFKNTITTIFENRYDYTRVFILFGMILFIITLYYLGKRN